MAEAVEFNTPLGRIVWGHPLKSQDKTDDNNQKVMKDGQVVKQWAFGVAFPKEEFNSSIWPYLSQAAQAQFPQGVPQKFSYKIKDGDSTEAPWNTAANKQGIPYNQRPGYAGHWILTVSTEFAAPAVRRFENGSYMEVNENGIKTGDYVMLQLNVLAHAGQSPGLYVNPKLVLHCYDGEAIGGSGFSADPTQAFGAAPQMPAMPAGAAPAGSTGTPAGGGAMPQMPGMGQPAPMGGMPGNGMGMPGAPAPAMGAPVPQQTTAPSPMAAPAPTTPMQMPPPAHDFVQNAGMPGQPQAAPGGMPQPGMMPGMPQPGMMPGMPGPR